ncbi:MAG: GNAT family N-acetyltransferase [Lysobacterales bacterium]
MSYDIRPITPADNAAVAQVIRSVMPEFGADGPGFAIHDAEVDHMAEAYAAPRSAYFVVVQDGQVCGGAGIAPLVGHEADTCELRKMYFLPALRGQGAGWALMQRCLAYARSAGFRQCYLETLTGMDRAARLYEQAGFQRLPAAWGATGHFGCNRFYALSLETPTSS